MLSSPCPLWRLPGQYNPQLAYYGVRALHDTLAGEERERGEERDQARKGISTHWGQWQSLRNRVVPRHQHVFLSLELGLLVRVLDEQSSSPGFDS